MVQFYMLTIFFSIYSHFTLSKLNNPPAPWNKATCYPYLVTQLDRFLSWADINRNCNTFLIKTISVLGNEMNKQIIYIYLPNCGTTLAKIWNHVFNLSSALLSFKMPITPYIKMSSTKLLNENSSCPHGPASCIIEVNDNS